MRAVKLTFQICHGMFLYRNRS